MGGSKVQSPDVQAARNPIKLYVRVAERNLSSQSPRRITRNYCAWSASGNREYLRNMLNRVGFMGKTLLIKEARQSHGFREGQ